jgi:hypothetical protein
MHGESPVMRPPRKATARSSVIAAPHALVAQRHLVILPVARREDSGGRVQMVVAPDGAVFVGEADCPR